MNSLSYVLVSCLVLHCRLLAVETDTTWSLVILKRPMQEFSHPDLTKTHTAKKPTAALAMALGHTLIPIGAGLLLGTAGDSNVEGVQLISAVGLMTYGGLVGPSMGNFYAKDYRRGGLGIAMRVVGTAMVAHSIGKAMSWGNDDEAEGPAPDQWMGTAGSFLVLGSAVWNIFTAASSAEAYNEKHGLTGFSVGYNLSSKSTLVGVQLTF